ncbi:MAG: basic amino acid ABC transporter substrate-binding protein [Candidatus Zixiibacteriota bacterium]
MKRLVLLLIVVFLMINCGGGKESSKNLGTVLLIGTDATYPPFESINPATDLPAGFDIDLIKEICKINDWQPKFVTTSFDRLISGLIDKKYDVVISAMSITPQRAALVDFSDPYYLAGQSIAVPLDDSTTSTAEDLMGKKVGVQRGTTGEQMAKKMEGLHVYSFDNIGAAFDELAKGNLDVVLNDFPTTRAYIKTQGKAKIVGEILSTEYYGIAVRKGEQNLLADINKALKAIKSSERFKEIHVKWFGSEPSAEMLADSVFAKK